MGKERKSVGASSFALRYESHDSEKHTRNISQRHWKMFQEAALFFHSGTEKSQVAMSQTLSERHTHSWLLCTCCLKYWYRLLVRYPCVMWFLFGFVSPTKNEQVNKMERHTKRLMVTIFWGHVSSAIAAVAKTRWLLFEPVFISLLMVWLRLLMQLMCSFSGSWYPAQVRPGSVPLKWHDTQMYNMS